MVRRLQPVLAIIGLVAIVAWLASIVPGSARVVTAGPSLAATPLGADYVAMAAADREADSDGRFEEESFVRGFDDEDEDEEGEGEDWDEEDEEEWDEDEDEERGDYEERDEDGEEWEEHEEHLEREMMYLELKRAELQAFFGEMELVQQVKAVAADADSAAILAIVSTTEELEEEEQLAFLRQMMSVSKSDTVKRLIQLKLAEVYGHMDRGDEALDMIRSVVAGE
ncbi:MAG: hypothetical protein AAGB00_08625 [Planctomycetota bacterium]